MKNMKKLDEKENRIQREDWILKHRKNHSYGDFKFKTI